MQHQGLTHQFLLSTPQLNGSYFEKAVIYICEHNREGAMGLMLNHELPVDLDNMFEQLDIQTNSDTLFKVKLLDGGPVNVQQGFIIHEKTHQQWENSIQINDNVYVTTSKDILDAIASDKIDEPYSVTLGYSGWAAGQIESELKEGSWVTIPASNPIIFEHEREKIWQCCLDQLGFDMNQLSSSTGNA